MIFPIAMMYWTIRRRSKYKNSIPEEQKMNEIDKSTSSSLAYRNVSIWMLLLFVAMILSAAGDSGQFKIIFGFGIFYIIVTIFVWLQH
jgi:hypothetical protein